MNYSPSPKIGWDTVQIQGSDLVIELKDGHYTTVGLETIRQLLNTGMLTTEDVRAIVRSEMYLEGWYKDDR